MRRKEYNRGVRLRHFISIFEELHNLQKNGRFCDIHLSVNDGAVTRTIPVHSLVLYSCSPYCCKVLGETVTKYSADEPMTLVFNDIDYKSLCTIVDFIYCGCLDIRAENCATVENVRNACQKFQLDTASEICRVLISQKKNQNTSTCEGADVSVKRKSLYQRQYTHLNPDRKMEPRDTSTMKSSAPCTDTQNPLYQSELSSATCIDVAKDLINSILNEVCKDRQSNTDGQANSDERSHFEQTSHSPAEGSAVDTTESSVSTPARRKRRKNVTSSFKTYIDNSNSESECLDSDDDCDEDDIPLSQVASENDAWQTTHLDNIANRFDAVFSKPVLNTKDNMTRIKRGRPKKQTANNAATTKQGSASKRGKYNAKKRNGDKMNSSPTYCKICDIDISDLKSFEEHCKLHGKYNSHKPRQCDICGKWLRCNTNLAMHRFGKHNMPFDSTKFVIYKCEVAKCDFTTIISCKFKLHMEVAHTTDTPYVCEKCGKAFRQKAVLHGHLATHSNERKYVCPECGKVFVSIVGRYHHIKRIHRQETSFLCHLCSCKFFENTELLQHLDKVHSIPMPDKYVRYKCDVCDYQTFKKKTFKSHQASHQGARPYVCPECGKCYASDGTLYKHMKFHKDPEHKCPHCDYAAVLKSRLTEHIRLKHTQQNVKQHMCHLCHFACALSGNLRKHLVNKHKLDLPSRKINKLTPMTGNSEQQRAASEEQHRAASEEQQRAASEEQQRATSEERYVAEAEASTRDVNMEHLYRYASEIQTMSTDDQVKQTYHETKLVHPDTASPRAVSSMCGPSMIKDEMHSSAYHSNLPMQLLPADRAIRSLALTSSSDSNSSNVYKTGPHAQSPTSKYGYYDRARPYGGPVDAHDLSMSYAQQQGLPVSNIPGGSSSGVHPMSAFYHLPFLP